MAKLYKVKFATQQGLNLLQLIMKLLTLKSYFLNQNIIIQFHVSPVPVTSWTFGIILFTQWSVVTPLTILSSNTLIMVLSICYSVFLLNIASLIHYFPTCCPNRYYPSHYCPTWSVVFAVPSSWLLVKLRVILYIGLG